MWLGVQKDKVKAFLLAAGLGTRLKPLTNSTPKCLMNICGRPLLSWWIEIMENHGINEVLINLHHLSEKVTEYINSHTTSIKFNYYYEEKLLGSAGTLRENKNFVVNEKNFFILYADNLTNYNLTQFLEFHNSTLNKFSMALFRTSNPTQKGIVELDEKKTVVSFEEKPSQPKSNLANAGLYICSPELLNLIPNNDITDIGYDFLPKLIGKISGWETNDYLIDIGTLEDLEKANREWLEIMNRRLL
jgi:mannose-1-phosphate guanylyltransferase